VQFAVRWPLDAQRIDDHPREILVATTETAMNEKPLAQHVRPSGCHKAWYVYYHDYYH
jgi:hypothetical protein